MRRSFLVLRPTPPPLKARFHAKRRDSLTVNRTLMQRIVNLKDQAMSQQTQDQAPKLSASDAYAIKSALIDCAVHQFERGLIYSPNDLKKVEDELVAAFLRINSQASL